MPGILRVLGLSTCLWWASATLASRASAASTPPPNRPGPALPGTASTLKTNRVTPALPGTKTAADTFRELLGMSATERAQVLADRTEHQRNYLEAQLRQFESLPPDLREARLKQLELSCHLTVLMKLAPTNRAEKLKAVPVDLRATIDERLEQWDHLPPQVRQDVMEYETTANYFLRVRPSDPSQAESIPGRLPPGQPVASDDSQSSKAASDFERFFGLPLKEQQKTLDVLPASEREEMEKTLKAFADLPAEQRKICVTSFDKFSRMSKEQRDQFLKNAARWKAMSPRERETWRTLLQILPPTPTVSTPPPLPTGSER